jgi:hypothetical protein
MDRLHELAAKAAAFADLLDQSPVREPLTNNARAEHGPQHRIPPDTVRI